MKTAIAFLAGLTFGFGLLVSGMSSPDKVLSFLDLAGAWDPSLAFVMGGAVLTATPFFLLAKRVLGEAPHYFDIERYSVAVDRRFARNGFEDRGAEAIVDAINYKLLVSGAR